MPTIQILQGSTWVVLATWLCVGAIFIGCGHLVRKALLGGAATGERVTLGRVDLWIGFAAFIAYVQVWTLAFRISGWTWLAPLIAGVLGLGLGARTIGLGRSTRRPPLVAATVAGAGLIWLANQTLGPPGLYDLGLYHLNIVEYAERYPAIPGLANLAIRLGASDPHLLLAASLDQGPWSGAGFQLVNGLLESMLLVDVVSRFSRHSSRPMFSTRLASLAAAATALGIAISPQHWLAAPNLDTGALVIVTVGLLYLAETVERGFNSGTALASASLLAAAAATRPLYWPCAIFATAVVLVLARRRSGGGRVRSALPYLSLPALIAAGWIARQVVLSGYPLFPLAFGGLPVDWRVAHSAIHAENQGDATFARVQSGGPGASSIFGSWHWLTASWLPARKHDLTVILPLMLLACVLPFLARLPPDPNRGRRTRSLLTVLAPVAATLLLWFLLIPDPRFAIALFWLVPIALAAWALPPFRASAFDAVRLILAGSAGGVALAWVWQVANSWVLLAALGGWAAVFAIALGLRARTAHLLAFSAVISALFAGIWIVAKLNAFETMPSNSSGPFGAPAEPVPPVESFLTNSNLRLVRPTQGDQCWEVLLCTPTPNTALRLRGSSVADGFNLSG